MIYCCIEHFLGKCFGERECFLFQKSSREILIWAYINFTTSNELELEQLKECASYMINVSINNVEYKLYYLSAHR